jgi:ferredoxin-NADP reductase
VKNYVLKSIEKYPEHYILNLSPQSQSDIFNFIPGQYIALGFEENNRPSPMRCFSIASSPDSQGIQIATRSSGPFTRKMTRLRDNTNMLVEGPFGEFNIPQNAKNVVMIAAGVGITPFMSMLRKLANQNINFNVFFLFLHQGVMKTFPFIKRSKK